MHEFPFANLNVCVTGFSKDVRRQVRDLTESLGGLYSGDLTPECTHLVVQRLTGPKFNHALKHGAKRGLHLVDFRWLLDSAAAQERLDEREYSLIAPPHSAEYDYLQLIASSDDEEVEEGEPGSQGAHFPLALYRKSDEPEATSISDGYEGYNETLALCTHSAQPSLFQGHVFFVDPDQPEDLRRQVHEAVQAGGSSCTEELYAGGSATHVVCEVQSVHKYVGRMLNIVTPMWVLRSVELNCLQRVIQLSADVGRQISMCIEGASVKSAIEALGEDRIPMLEGSGLAWMLDLFGRGGASSHELETETKSRQQKAREAKLEVRRRRGQCKQPCRTFPRMPTPPSLLDSLCWAVSEPPSDATFFADCPESTPTKSDQVREALKEIRQSNVPNSNAHDKQNKEDNVQDSSITRRMTDSEREEVVYKEAFLTILFPVDRFGEIGPRSKTLFLKDGLTRDHLLSLIYDFYQAPMTDEEVEVALHTDSKYADRLRAMYSLGNAEAGASAQMTRIDFMGSRRSFEGLKRVSRDITGQVYELFLGS